MIKSERTRQIEQTNLECLSLRLSNLIKCDSFIKMTSTLKPSYDNKELTRYITDKI